MSAIKFEYFKTIEYFLNPRLNLHQKINALWYAYQYTSFFYLSIMTIVRFTTETFDKNNFFNIEHETKENKKRIRKYLIIDYIMKIHIVLSQIFYSLDTISQFYLLYKYNRICNFCYIIHHLVTLGASFCFKRTELYPFFVIMPFAGHAILLMFTDGLINKVIGYFYFSSLLFSFYKLGHVPYKNFEYFRTMKKFGYALMVPVVLMWFCKCSNSLNLADNIHLIN